MAPAGSSRAVATLAHAQPAGLRRGIKCIVEEDVCGNMFKDLVDFTNVQWDGWSTQGTVIGLSACSTIDWALIALSFTDKRGVR